MMSFTMSTKLITGMVMTALFIGIALSAVSYFTMNNNLIESAQEKLISDIDTGYAYLDSEIPGEWSVRGDELFKGDILINGNLDIVDRIGELTNGNSVTIFLGDTRVATNVLDSDGERAIGTQVSDDVADTVLVDEERFIGRANVVGEWNQAAYDPIRNEEGEVIGIWYTGVPETPYVSLAQEAAVQTIVIAVLIVILSSVIGTFVLRKMIIKPLHSLKDSANEIANLNLNTTIFKSNSKDEIGQLSTSFNLMKENLLTIIHSVQTTSNEATSLSAKLAESSDRTASITEQVSSSIQE